MAKVSSSFSISVTVAVGRAGGVVVSASAIAGMQDSTSTIASTMLRKRFKFIFISKYPFSRFWGFYSPRVPRVTAGFWE